MHMTQTTVIFATVNYEKIACLKRLRLRVLRRMQNFLLCRFLHVDLQMLARCTYAIFETQYKISLLATVYWCNCFVIYTISYQTVWS